MPRPFKVHVDKYKFEVQTACIIDVNENVNLLFNAIVNDYCRRFKVKIPKAMQQTKVQICFVPETKNEEGLCAFEDLQHRLMITVQCPLLGDKHVNRELAQMLLQTLCHEIVHACQTLTGRDGFAPDYTKTGVGDEDYYFEPFEIEARALADFYAWSNCRTYSTYLCDAFVNSYNALQVDLTELIKVTNAKTNVRYRGKRTVKS